MTFKFTETEIPVITNIDDNPFTEPITAMVKGGSKKALTFEVTVPKDSDKDITYWINRYKRQMQDAADKLETPVSIICPLPKDLDAKAKSCKLTFWSAGKKITRTRTSSADGDSPIAEMESAPVPSAA